MATKTGKRIDRTMRKLTGAGASPEEQLKAAYSHMKVMADGRKKKKKAPTWGQKLQTDIKKRQDWSKYK